MKEYTCDICSEKCSCGADSIKKIFDYKVKQDESASVRVMTSFSFENHSSGYGGPPDLCHSCIRRLLKENFDGFNNKEK